METRDEITRLDFRIADWGFSLNVRSGKIEVYRANRPDLAHLTIAWKTPRGEPLGSLDVHLTYGHEQAMAARASQKDWRPFAQVPMPDLERLGQRADIALKEVFVRRIHRFMRRVRPGWLARRGYWVAVPDRDKFMAVLRELAPKRRSKYRVSHETLENPDRFGLADDAHRFLELYDPHVLHVLEPTDFSTSPIVAVTQRKGRSRLMLGHQRGPDGKLGWWAINEAEMARTMNKVVSAFFDWLVPRVRPEHNDKLEELRRGLGCDDYEFTRDLCNRVGQFISAPRNPVRMPYPKLRAVQP